SQAVFRHFWPRAADQLAVWPFSGSFGWRRLKIAQQPFKGRSIGIVVLQLLKSGNEVLADLARAVDLRVGVEQLPGTDQLERDECNWEQHLGVLLLFPSSRIRDFGLHPVAVRAGIRRD